MPTHLCTLVEVVPVRPTIETYSSGRANDYQQSTMDKEEVVSLQDQDPEPKYAHLTAGVPTLIGLIHRLCGITRDETEVRSSHERPPEWNSLKIDDTELLTVSKTILWRAASTRKD